MFFQNKNKNEIIFNKAKRNKNIVNYEEIKSEKKVKKHFDL